MNIRSVEEIRVDGLKVLLRVDFNVPLSGKDVADDTRIRAALPTIQYLLERNARLIIVSHLGRPKGEPREELRLDPVAARLSELLGRPVRKLDHVAGPEVEAAVESLLPGGIIMLENVRFEKGEEKNDPELARRLASPADLFVNDAFGAAHRAHASTAGVAQFIPAAAGLLMMKEITILSHCLENPGRPLVVILGGAKISDKINVIRRFLDLADTLLIGGGMANTFLVSQGYDLGGSLYEKELTGKAREILKEAERSKCSLQLPADLVVTDRLEPGSAHKIAGPNSVGAGWKAVDIGPETVEKYSRAVTEAGMIVWNGPLGVFEVEPFHYGTEAVARAIAGSGAFSVVGGGDIVAALEKLGLAGKIDFISTGGGATLEFWEGRELPGIAVLADSGRGA